MKWDKVEDSARSITPRDRIYFPKEKEGGGLISCQTFIRTEEIAMSGA